MNDSIEVTLARIQMSLEHLEKLPDRVRKLEDRTIVQQFVEKILWIAIGVLISILIQQQFVAVTTKNENQYETNKKLH